LFADRFDIIEDPMRDKNIVSFYGYIRGGTHITYDQKLHINGMGDYDIKEVKKMPDPCPIEIKQVEGVVKKKRVLNSKDKHIYAPMSSLGAVNLDRSSGYVTIPDRFVTFTKITDENN
jgi:ribosome biogenesis protein BMS1